MTTSLDHLFQRAVALHAAGALQEAEEVCQIILRQVPDRADALHLAGLISGRKGDHLKAIALLQTVLDLGGPSPIVFNNLGNAFQALARNIEALVAYDKALALKPDYPTALRNRGTVLRQLNRIEEAIEAHRRAISLQPDYIKAILDCGTDLEIVRRFSEALESYDAALLIDPSCVDAWISRTRVLIQLGQFSGALSSADRAMPAGGRRGYVLLLRASALRALDRPLDALSCCDLVLSINSRSAEAYFERAVTLQQLGRKADALTNYDLALQWDPALLEALNNRANLLAELRRYEEAARDFATVLELNPDHEYAPGAFLHVSMHCCDWKFHDKSVRNVKAGIANGKIVCVPFALLAVSDSPQELQRCAQIHVADRFSTDFETPFFPSKRGDKIRLGYVSGEFDEQATSSLTMEMFERHDRNRFELYAFDCGSSDDSSTRRRLKSSFDVFTNISRIADIGATKCIRENEIDILLNLNGYFGYERTGIFARRAAPLQINYLGWPGTMGAPFMDYIVADEYVLPLAEQEHFNEKIISLHGSYQVNSSRNLPADTAPSRARENLPEDAFVFCCFNNTYKITPEVFDVWMRLLRRVSHGVLWLFEANAAVAGNLRQEAVRRGISPERLVFAPRVSSGEHLARHKLADLFLDTLPCNAHTTASDALWMGVPLITCTGKTFPGRVATSLLQALKVPELITASLADYEALALDLAMDRGALDAVREKLIQNRQSAPLFDVDRYVRCLEAGFELAWERYLCGLGAGNIAVREVPDPVATLIDAPRHAGI